ncbi:cobalamin-binding protein [Candidatus Poribacteria bacterium]|nr:cobalamin-binding protein [Candidatus Poribacteria bacterium]
MINLTKMSEKVVVGDAEKVEEMVKQALDEGMDAITILNEGLVKGMDVIGEKFKNYEVYLPGLIVAARAMKAGLSVLKPVLANTKDRKSVKIAIGTVQGDTHDIGKNIVAAMLEGAGFEVVDLGYDVSSQDFISAIKDGVQVVGMSALVTTNMLSMKETIEAIIEAGLRDKAKIIIGGAPVTQEYADKIGADAYAEDAAIAVDVVRDFFK